ncbi:aminoglycoside phosphotransferase family protein [Alkalihalophilus lindianensis]|uniref:Aminoglycoside phosphotransferase family protein n=1 Tax=Alkalihalophilus lindianensis TaxID=1630542 RepID=A0ABU3XDU4_9BACI|nr:aminoglycoside phosphotransferase family protein [Alkalihalophilus lindianensis]MDV2686046.1 aminoglycoside phosphotransferase family protein [Alkalihalophilus lindianensis]
MKFQEHFVQSVHLYLKEDAKQWLGQIPSIIKACEEKWALTIREAYELSINYVATATTKEGTEVVVKICIPGGGFDSEVEALKLFAGRGIVNVIDIDEDMQVILLEELNPGYTLATSSDDEKACLAAAGVMKDLITTAPTETKILTTKAREENLRNIIDKHAEGVGPLSKQILDQAAKIFTYMNQTTKTHYLLHGDFHPYNILKSEDGWKAIDPKGLIGEVEYDLIQYMLNVLPEEGIKEVTKERVDLFTEKLTLNKERLLLWGYCHTVLATAWTVDEDGSYNKSFYQMIEVWKELYKEQYGEPSL